MSADAAQSDSSNPPQRGTARAWLQLFRVPNLLTVPGDPIAGVFLAAAAANAAIPASAMFAAMAVSLLLYGAGLLQNDYFDLPEDRRERPRRPLPSGAVRPVYAIAVAVSLRATTANFAGVTEYLKRLPKEHEVFAVRDALAREADLQDTTAFSTWASANVKELT